MTAEWQVLAVLAMGLVLIVLGLFIRLGMLRRWVQPYFHPDLPSHVGNAFFGFIPLGAMAIFEVLSLVCLQAGQDWRALGIIMAQNAMHCLALAWLLSAFPPDWIKPRWLRERERLLRPEPKPEFYGEGK